MKAMKKYFDKQADKYIDWANEGRTPSKSYNEDTNWGSTPGAFIE